MAEHIDVMISSTSQDLPEHRKEIQDAILRLGMHPIAMEHLGARYGVDAISASLEMVDLSEVYLGVFGMRYGYIPDDPRNPEQISITELEYRRALERDIPILIFLMDEDKHLLSSKDFETESESIKKLQSLKIKLSKNHIIGFFTSPEDLRSLVIQGLAKVQLEAAKRAGENDHYIRERHDNAILAPDLLAIPRYTLTNQFIGRSAELDILNEWSQSHRPVMVVDAIGGMGKSALTWEWVNQELQKESFEGRFWFSFYERGTNMISFLKQALAYCTKTHFAKFDSFNRQELIYELLSILDNNKYLLVLDGLERVLVAYHRIDKAHIRDDQVITDKRYRETTDPKDGQLLKQLLTVHQSKLLMTTRLLPRALEDEGDPLNNVAYLRLGGLHPDDAYELMKAKGVKIRDRKLLDDFMARFGYHSLLLTIIAGRIKTFRADPGSFEKWYEVYGRDLQDPDIQQQRLKLLSYAFDGLSETASKFLGQVAAFSDSVDYEVLSVFNPFLKREPLPMKRPSRFASDKRKKDYRIYREKREAYKSYEGSSEYFKAIAQFDTLLRELNDRDLLNWERQDNSYDLHPVVRGHCFDLLEKTERKETYEAIHNHFEKQFVTYKQVKNIDELHEPIIIYQSLIGADKLDQAVTFYKENLSRILLYNLNSNYTISELLSPLFPENFDHFPKISQEDMKGWCANELSIAFHRSGKLREAMSLEELNLKHDVEYKNNSELAIHLQNHSQTLLAGRYLTLAIHAGELSLDVSKRSKKLRSINISYALLYYYYGLVGEWELAEQYRQRITKSDDLVSPYVYRSMIQFYREEDNRADIELAWDVIQKSRNAQWGTAIAHLEARTSLKTSNLDDALRQIDKAIQLAHQSDSAELASCLATRSLIIAMIGTNLNEARYHIELALDTNLWMSQASYIYYCASRVYGVLRVPEKSREYAIKAYESSFDRSGQYSRWYDQKLAKQNMEALNLVLPEIEMGSTETPGYMKNVASYIRIGK